MIKWFSIFRWSGYICGGAGLALVLVGRRLDPPVTAVQVAGAILLLAMFLCFVCTQIMFMLYRLNRKKGEVPPAGS